MNRRSIYVGPLGLMFFFLSIPQRVVPIPPVVIVFPRDERGRAAVGSEDLGGQERVGGAVEALPHHRVRCIAQHQVARVVHGGIHHIHLHE